MVSSMITISLRLLLLTKVVPDMYQPYTLSFIQFEAVLEGLLTLRRIKSGRCNIINNMNPHGNTCLWGFIIR